ncbi:hypothetical protein J7E88_19360 [Streptomyces sp. ISL-10]|uniref:hypothetical protein n=1 Tax=Streptomyces sp. ISL-10 TaxID=2819172 RepID=UPI001BEC0741|nr:hypothetical protein [Streptomyces sp. ISL-10]MBT2367403.1 hypothetical protein [Streptomyces sp. ISL-10]
MVPPVPQEATAPAAPYAYDAPERPEPEPYAPQLHAPQHREPERRGPEPSEAQQPVSTISSDSSDGRPAGGGAPEQKPGHGTDHRTEVGNDPPAAPAAPSKPSERSERPRPKRPKRTKDRHASPAFSKWPMSALDAALASGPSSHTISPALRSPVRLPASVLLFACGVIHLPTDLAGLRSGSYTETLSLALLVLCLVCALWLAMRDTLVVWAAAAGLAVGIIALHGLASVGTVDLLNSSLGQSFTRARAAAVLCAAAAAILSGSTLVRRTRAAGATKST